jgi:hypothetical protein
MVQNRVFDEVIDFITSIPQPQEILNYKPSKFTQNRLDDLLEKKRNDQLSEEEIHEMEQFVMTEHIMRIAKIKAKKSLQQ